jgi:hypothetical protein
MFSDLVQLSEAPVTLVHGFKLEGQPCEKLEGLQIDLSTHQPKGHHLENPWYTKLRLAVGIHQSCANIMK